MSGVDSTLHVCPGCGVKVIGHKTCGDPTRPGCAAATRVTDEAVEKAARTYYENLGWDWDDLGDDRKEHDEGKAIILREFRAALEAALPHLQPQVDREALARVIAESLVRHFPTRGMQVASGVTCECGYWTGGEPQALLGAGMGGRDQLNRHRSTVAAVAVLALLSTEVKS